MTPAPGRDGDGGDARGGPEEGGDVRLIESLRWDGRLHRADLHLGRMEGSARSLGFRFDAPGAGEALGRAADRLEGDRPRKVRMTLGREGDLEIDVVEIDPLPEPVPVLLVDERVDPEDELLYHKTDRRRLYDGTRQRAERRGYREVVFRNTRGEVTEGSFTNVFVRQGDVWYTPPVSCGLLPGVGRAELLERLEGAEERVLRPADVASADSVWLCNSVRGMKRARLAVEGEGAAGDG